MWFDEIADSEDPGREDLYVFLQKTRRFLNDVVQTAEFDFLWIGTGELRNLASETFESDIVSGAGLQLDNEIPRIPSRELERHGLTGRPLRFKLSVLAIVDRQWNSAKPTDSVSGWFKRMIDAIDAILDSLVDAASGGGGIIKEFKDALRALVW